MSKHAFLLISLLMSFVSGFSQWTDLNSGINDHLTGIVMISDTGIVSGHKGLYITETGGQGPGSWTRYEVTGNAADSLLYNQTRFEHCAYGNDPQNQIVFACGRDTISNTPVIFEVNLATFTYQVTYHGSGSGGLNHVGYKSYNKSYYAVGDSGLVVYIKGTTVQELTSGLDWDFTTIFLDVNAGTIGSTKGLVSISTQGGGFLTIPHATPGKAWNMVSGSIGLAGGPEFAKFESSITPGDTGQLSINTRYDYAPLDANCFYPFISVWIGTDDGIYKAHNWSFDPWLEIAPGTIGYKINSFYFRNQGNTIFGCGANGAVVQLTNHNTPTKPYIYFDPEPVGGCIGSTLQINAFKGSGNSSQWYVDGTLASTTNSAFSYTLNSTTPVDITLIVTNSAGLKDTASVTVAASGPPLANLTYSVADTIVCKKEPIEIVIPNPEPLVQYELRRYGSPGLTFGISDTSNGNPLTLISDSLDQQGWYYLRAINAISPTCFSDFTDSIDIQIEQTLSVFTTVPINAEVNESVRFIPLSINAQQYEWEFSGNASLSSSNQSSPVVSFSQADTIELVQLISISAEGCRDTATAQGPGVYDTSSLPDTCWNLVFDGPDPQWQGYYNPDLSAFAITQDGFIVAGRQENMILPSRKGRDAAFRFEEGRYLAKYTDEGVLRWRIQLRGDDYFGNFDGLTVDNLDNIYLASDAHGVMFDTKGDSLQSGFQVVKFNSNGEFDWNRQILSSLEPFEMILDGQGNILICGKFSNQLIFYEGNTPVDTFFQPLPFSPSPSTQKYVTHGVIKLSPNGDLIWGRGLDLRATNREGLSGIAVDSLDNLYLTGYFGQDLEIFHPDTTTTTLVQRPDSSALLGEKLFIIKYSATGDLLWNSIAWSNPNGSDDTHPAGIEVSPDGTVYLAGSSTGTQMTFENPNGSTTIAPVGTAFLAKLSPSGNCQWIRGTTNPSQNGGFFKFEKTGEKLFLEGVVSQFGDPTAPVDFLSSNSVVPGITVGFRERFWVEYDTAGVFSSVHKSGDNLAVFGIIQSPSVPNSLQSTEQESFFTLDNYRITASGPYSHYGSDIPVTQAYAGILTRFNRGCFIEAINCDEIVGNDSLQFSGITLSQPGLTNWDSLQWVSCDNNFAPIPGESGPTFDVPASGSYALITTVGECKDTSFCLPVVLTENILDPSRHRLEVYPNPNQGQFEVVAPVGIPGVNLRFFDLHGRLIHTETIPSDGRLQVNLPFPDGVYVMKASGKNWQESYLITIKP